MLSEPTNIGLLGMTVLAVCVFSTCGSGADTTPSAGGNGSSEPPVSAAPTTDAKEIHNKAVTDATPINTVCPVTGRKVDPSLSLVRIDLAQDAHHRIWVGLCSDDCRKQVLADPQRFGQAAVQNRQAVPSSPHP